MTFKEFTGKNVEEAIRTAMRDFGAELSDLDIEILSQGSRGILGVGGEDARILAAPKSAVAAADTVRMAEPAAEPADEADEADGAPAASPAAADEMGDQVAELARAERNARSRGGVRGGRGRGERGGRERGDGRGTRAPRGELRAPREPRADRPPREPREPREPAPFIPAKPLEELTEAERSAIEGGRDVLTEMLRLMGMDATVEIAMGTETSKLNVKGSDLGVLIGRRGEKLASLQHLVNLIVAKREGQWHRISVDVENYRGRREEQLRDVADRAAKRVIQSGKIIQLEPMPAVERRIVHMALVENSKVRTQSVGVEPNRRIVVLPAAKAER
ncbi:MAG TPA: RNA-binding cell elongation regulator Jag/EloR [Candidatus Limnocylindria bacterium]|jgi:spoIIIJ-associated protein|nr:RNA-binding cell elongation regulator Jag/EloR [Candidatus Limnocylindria bacterium]